MELQASLKEYDRNRIAVFAISYDSVDVLEGFASRYDIQFPLLSDAGSVVISRLGLRNDRLQEHHAFYGGSVRDDQWGVPYPGAFVLDERGVIVEKRFADSYRERETAVGLLEASFGELSGSHGAEAASSVHGVGVRAYLDSSTYRAMQRLRLTVEMSIPSGQRIYGRPIPDGYVPLTIEVAPLDGLAIGTTALPDPAPFAVDGLDEEFTAYAGDVHATIPLTFGKAIGDQTLGVTVHFQTCTSDACVPPSSVLLSLPVQYLSHVERPD